MTFPPAWFILEVEKTYKEGEHMKKLRKLWILALCALMLVSCSEGQAMMDDSVAGKVESAPEASLGGNGEVGENSTVSVSDRKLIRDVTLNVETKGFDSLLADLNARTIEMGGYIEQSDIGGTAYEAEKQERRATVTYRIPSVKVDEFLAHVGENSNILQRTEQTRDVTLTYVDLESRIKALESERDALLDLLEKADSTSSILSIRSQLNDVIYQYESATAKLRALSEQVDYSTIKMTICEVIEYTEPAEKEQTAWEKISTGFVDSCLDVAKGAGAVATFFLINLPHLVVWGLIIGGGILWIRGSKKRKARRRNSTDLQGKS